MDRLDKRADHSPLSPEPRRRTSAPVTADLFDRRLRALRRDRAARIGPELPCDRAFGECLDRLRDIARPARRCLLIVPVSRLAAIALRSRRGSGRGTRAHCSPLPLAVQRWRKIGSTSGRSDDLAVAIGTLDSVNDLPLALKLIHRALRPGSPLIGASGGNSLPALRASLIEAGRAEGRVVARTHPRIEGPTVAALLSAAGYSATVVDIDRVTLRYSDLATLIRDLRAMGASSMLADHSRGLTRREFQNASNSRGLGTGGRTEERIEIIHFLGWRE